MAHQSTPDNDPKTEAIQRAFEGQLNKHGYGFQYAVIHRAKELFSKQFSAWEPLAAEVPVDQGPGTKIDLVLRNGSYRNSTWIIGECKRVNPAFADWCFVSAPFTHTGRRPQFERMSSECLYFDPLQPADNPRVRIEQREGVWLDKAYQIGIEIRGGGKGDVDAKNKTGTGAIEDAASQVLRGVNGFVNTLVRYPEMLTYERPNIMLPVIFTTAQLWVSDADLSKSNLTSGNIDVERAGFQRADWIWYQYHTSPALRHPHEIEREIIADFEMLMDSQYIRTLAVIGMGGVDKFLQWSSSRNFI